MNPPYSSTSTAVAGYVRVRCSDRLDNANTGAQIQRYAGGAWQNQGTITTSYSTGSLSGGEYVIHVHDTAAKSTGTWYYRMEGTHFGQHGNIMSLPTYHSNSRQLVRSS